MSKNGNVAMEAQKKECEAAIDDIRSTKPAGTCQAHESMCRGLIALLRCKIAEIDLAQDADRRLKILMWRVVGKAAAGTVAIVCIILAICSETGLLARIAKAISP